MSFKSNSPHTNIKSVNHSEIELDQAASTSTTSNNLNSLHENVTGQTGPIFRKENESNQYKETSEEAPSFSPSDNELIRDFFVAISAVGATPNASSFSNYTSVDGQTVFDSLTTDSELENRQTSVKVN